MDDLALDVNFRGRMLTGKAMHREVIQDALLRAKRSVWIATANVKELYVDQGKRQYGSLLGSFAELSRRGVELRMLHAELPSRRFRATFERQKVLQRGGLQLKHCPRVHWKFIVIDGSWLYFGSANLTGAGLGAKGDHKRNFEFGFVTEDFQLLDRFQSMMQSVWSGDPCRGCALREVCPDPGPYQIQRVSRAG